MYHLLEYNKKYCIVSFEDAVFTGDTWATSVADLTEFTCLPTNTYDDIDHYTDNVTRIKVIHASEDRFLGSDILATHPELFI